MPKAIKLENTYIKLAAIEYFHYSDYQLSIEIILSSGHIDKTTFIDEEEYRLAKNLLIDYFEEV